MPYFVFYYSKSGPGVVHAAIQIRQTLGIRFWARTSRVRYFKGKCSYIELKQLTTLRANDFEWSKNNLLNEES